MIDSECGVVVIGGGIAGASIAANLAEHVAVRLLEMESQPGYHSTGRSAARFSETYGNGTIRAEVKSVLDSLSRLRASVSCGLIVDRF